MSGRVGYEAYALFTRGKTCDGRDMPEWDELSDNIQGAWNFAAGAIERNLPVEMAAARDNMER